MTIDWEDVELHKKWINHPDYLPFVGLFAEVFDLELAPPFFCTLPPISCPRPRSLPIYTQRNSHARPHIQLTLCPDHVNFTTDSVPARTAPVTEIASFNISTTASAAEKSQLEDNVLKVTQFCHAQNCRGATVGWAIEEIDAPNGKVNPLQIFIGWDSVEDHMKAREHPSFAGLVGPIRAACSPPKDGVQGMAMFHTQLREGKAA